MNDAREPRDWGGPDYEGGPNLEQVRFHLEVDGVDAALGVRRVSLQEGPSRMYAGSIEALHRGDFPDPGSLLGCRFELRVERGASVRTLRGIVRHAALTHPPEGPLLALSVVPSAWRLTLGQDTRTYLDLTVPELVAKIVEERLGGAVEVDTSRLSHTYERHELLLQYQESPWNFVNRWMEQEGIFFYEEETGPKETIVLADSMRNLPVVGSGGEVAYWSGDSAEPSEEYVFDLRRDQELGTTNVAVGDYDWTQPEMSVRDARAASSPLDPAPEIYEHASAVSFHRYGGQSYQHNTVQHTAKVRSEAVALALRHWSARAPSRAPHPAECFA